MAEFCQLQVYGTISSLGIVEIVSTQRTARAVRTPEPAEQARSMEHVLTRSTFLARGLHVCADDTVADGTLGLSRQRAADVPSEGDQTFNHTARAEDDDLDGPQP